MQLFSAEPTIFSKKKKKFAHENFKKQASKVAHNRPKSYFSQSSQAHSPKLIFSYYKYVPRRICLLICELRVRDSRASPAQKSQGLRVVYSNQGIFLGKKSQWVGIICSPPSSLHSAAACIYGKLIFLEFMCLFDKFRLV
jgi:hypothetical protein